MDDMVILPSICRWSEITLIIIQKDETNSWKPKVAIISSMYSRYYALTVYQEGISDFNKNDLTRTTVQYDIFKDEVVATQSGHTYLTCC